MPAEPLAVRCRDRVAQSLGVDLSHAFERAWWSPSRGLLKSPDRVEARRRIWTAMRAEGLSYPEISAACGMNSWSSIVEVCNRGASRD